LPDLSPIANAWNVLIDQYCLSELPDRIFSVTSEEMDTKTLQNQQPSHLHTENESIVDKLFNLSTNDQRLKRLLELKLMLQSSLIDCKAIQFK
jgi:hypothetical protein